MFIHTTRLIVTTNNVWLAIKSSKSNPPKKLNFVSANGVPFIPLTRIKYVNDVIDNAPKIPFTHFGFFRNLKDKINLVIYWTTAPTLKAIIIDKKTPNIIIHAYPI